MKIYHTKLIRWYKKIAQTQPKTNKLKFKEYNFLQVLQTDESVL
jgi:hypothetical protein